MPSSQVFAKFGKGQLHSGSKSGPVVKNRKQAIAIEISEKKNEAKHGGTYIDEDGQPQKTVRNAKPKRKGA